MQKEYEVVIADTSCFILLDKIDELPILKLLFEKVITTDIIAKEFGSQLPEWIEIRNAKNIIFQNSLDIDLGEASAITLALEFRKSLLILDDNKGRRAAQKLNLRYTGTLGVILKVKQIGIITSIKPIISKIQATNFRFSDKVLIEIYALADE